MLLALAMLSVGFAAGFITHYHFSHRKKTPELPSPEPVEVVLYDVSKINSKTSSSSIRMESILQNLYTCLISKRQTPAVTDLMKLASKPFCDRYEKTAQTFHDGITRNLVESLDIYEQQRLVSAYNLFETIEDDLERLSKHMLPLLLHAEEDTFLFQNTIDSITKLLNECLRRLDMVDETIDDTLYGTSRQKELVVGKDNLLHRLRMAAAKVEHDPELTTQLSTLEGLLAPVVEQPDKRYETVLNYYAPTVISVLEYYQRYGDEFPDMYKLIRRSVDSLIVILKSENQQKQNRLAANAATDLQVMEQYAQMKGDLPSGVQLQQTT